MRARAWRLLALAPVASLALVLWPAPAAATVSCALVGDQLTVSFDAGTDLPKVQRNVNAILVTDGATEVVCTGGPATVTNVAHVAINYTGVLETQNNAEISLLSGRFEPGTGGPAEGSGTPEIEFDVDLGAGPSQDVLEIAGDFNAADNWHLGTLPGGDPGANLNAPEAAGADGDDVRMHSVERVKLTAGFAGESSSNTVDLTGTPEFAGAFALPADVFGGNGADTLRAGSAATTFEARAGNDLLVSGSGDDTFHGDEPIGTQGTDTVTYASAAAAVNVDLALNAPQGTGGAGTDHFPNGTDDVENLTGSGFADTLAGSAAANTIVGGAGADTISARDGADTVDVNDAAAGDSANCGPGTDSATADSLDGVPEDTLTDCENVTFVNRTSPPPPPPPPPPADKTPPETTITKQPKPRTHKRRVRFEFASSEPGSSFECYLDGVLFGSCNSPLRTGRLSLGRHKFKVVATDAAGNRDPTPAKARFTVVKRPGHAGGGHGPPDH